MRCQPCREALSARLDGEDPGIPDEVVARHLAGCAGCRRFEATSALVRRRLAVRRAEQVPDLTEPILARAYAGRREARVASARAAGSAHWTRWALLAVALTQLVLSVPPMMLGHDANAPVHLARELGAWDLALAAALLLVVFRPARAVGLVPFAGALAFAMFAGALADVVSGRAAPLAESQHLLELLGLGLLWLISRRPADDTPLLVGWRRARPTLAA